MFVKTQRPKDVRTRLRARLETIANPGFRDQVFWRGGVGLNFLAQLPHENAQVFRLLRAVRAPNGSEQGPVRDHLTRTARQVDQ